MALDGVPWFIGGPDAEHGPEVARMLAYLAANGKQGVVAPSDLKVVPLDVPGAGVKVLAGGASILNRIAAQQAYSVRNPTADPDSVKITATGSSGGRSDLIVARVDNPYVDDNAQDPADPVKGPYDRFDVLAGVPAGTKRVQDIPQYAGLSAIELARIDLPANTGTVTSAMITDLRKLANPQETTIELSDLGVNTATLSATSGTIFPPYRPEVVVPDWANYARVSVQVASVSAAGNSTGAFNVQLQTTSGTNVVEGNSVAFNADASQTSTRFTMLATAEGDVTAVRGQTLRPTMYARKTSSSQANVLYDGSSQMIYRVTFYERIA